MSNFEEIVLDYWDGFRWFTFKDGKPYNNQTRYWYGLAKAPHL